MVASLVVNIEPAVGALTWEVKLWAHCRTRQNLSRYRARKKVKKLPCHNRKKKPVTLSYPKKGAAFTVPYQQTKKEKILHYRIREKNPTPPYQIKDVIL